MQKQKPYKFTTNTLKAYLNASAQPSSLSAIMISKTHIVAQRPRGRQLNAKVCSSESAFFGSVGIYGTGNPVHLPSPNPYPTCVLTNPNFRCCVFHFRILSFFVQTTRFNNNILKTVYM